MIGNPVVSRGGVTQGSNLDPASGNYGTPYFREQEFAEGEAADVSGILFQRGDDTSRIEWRFVL